MGNINFNPNLFPGDPPSEELVVQKLGGLIRGYDKIRARWDTL